MDGAIRKLEVEQLYREPLSAIDEEKERLRARMDVISGDLQEAESRVRRLELEVGRDESKMDAGNDGDVARDDVSEALRLAKDERDLLREDVQYVESRSMMVEGVINGEEPADIVRAVEAKQSAAQVDREGQDNARSDQNPSDEERSVAERSSEERVAGERPC